MENLFKEEINKKLKNLVFIDLKEEYHLEDVNLPVGFSLPIKLDYLIEGIKAVSYTHLTLPTICSV